MNKKVGAIIRYLLSIHILVLIIFSAFRIGLYFANINQVEGIENTTSLLWTAMLKGLRFDNTMACYILALPLVLLSILSFFGTKYKGGIRFSNIYFSIAYFFLFSISAGDIPYFKYYFGHIGVAALDWLGYGDTYGMMFQEVAYYPYITAFFVAYICFCVLVFRFGAKANKTEKRFGFRADLEKSRNKTKYIPLYLALLGICFLGIRGGTGQFPLRISHAYFSDIPFFNQLGVNPSFHLIKSIESLKYKYNSMPQDTDVQKTINWVKADMKIETDSSFVNPMSRHVATEGDPVQANVVLVLMESLSDTYLSYTGKNGKTLTPYLHQLMKEGYYFDNFYSTGTHTNNGIVGSLYGYPSLLNKPMMRIDVDHYTGLPFQLKKRGYDNLFFIGGDPNYDHMNLFLLENGINRIYSIDDYPKDKISNTFGVQDDYLLEFALDKMTEKYNAKKPFFASVLTVSNHPPLVIPDRFKNIGKTSFDDILAFADYSLQNFMEKAKKEAWYENTIFVFVGDHGRVLGKQSYEMSLSYNHVPLLIYSPLLKDMPRQINNMGTQLDIYPTLMGLLNIEYVNNSMGIDLLKDEKRDFAHFTSDTHLGCIQDEFFYMYNVTNNTDALYKYREKDTKDYSSQYAALRDSMKHYSFSMMNVASHITDEKLMNKE